MLKENQENIRQNTKIARICAESHELKELRSKLQLAMVSKERSNQIQQQVLIQERNSQFDAELDDMMVQDKIQKDREAYEERLFKQSHN
jgi:hypothetical protein